MRKPFVLAPSQGRDYHMGGLTASFKADGEETQGLYSISEWWLEPHTSGPGIHKHEEDDVFYVLQGCMSFYMEDKWFDAVAGSFVLVPGGTEHDFENRSDQKAGVLNFSAPGNFEQHMPQIVAWFQDNPPHRV